MTVIPIATSEFRIHNLDFSKIPFRTFSDNPRQEIISVQHRQLSGLIVCVGQLV